MAKKICWTVEMAEKQIEKWERIKLTIQRSDVQSCDDEYTKIYKLYLKHTSVSEVAKILSDEGVRIPSPTGGRKISSNDISDIIRTRDIPDKELQNLVRSIFANAAKFINSIYN